MSALDELRELLLGLAPEELEPPTLLQAEVLEALDEYDAAHPGLVDHTMHCATCGAPVWNDYCVWAEEVGGVLVYCDEHVPWRQP